LEVRIDVSHKSYFCENTKKSNETKEAELNQYRTQNNQLKDQMEKIGLTLEDTNHKLGEKKLERKKLINKIRLKTFKNEGLRTQRKFINENFDLKKWLETIDINTMRSAMYENQNANETIKDLITKFDEMKKFSTETAVDDNTNTS